MSSNIIYANGQTSVVVPDGEKIAVFTKGRAIITKVVGYPNVPSEETLLSELSNGQYVSAAVSGSTTIKIENDSEADVLYQVGSAPVVLENYDDQTQPTPTAKTTAVTLTIGELLTGIITATQSSGATVAYTLPTGTLSDAGLEMAVDESFDWILINLSAAAADTVTVTAGTAHTVVGTMVVASAHATTGLLYGNAAQFRTRKTAANTFVTYRIA